MKKFQTGLLALFTLIAATPLFAQDPEAMPDDSWISLSGTVTTALPESFTLDYGEGTILVEMDEPWDWYDEDYEVLPGDEVTVYGEVDDDLYEKATIEASSVYVHDLNTFFYASSIDEEDALYATSFYNVYDATDLTLRGTVTSVNGREFTIDTGLQQMTVDTDEMAYNPMDDQGYQQIDVGDRVSVNGWIDLDVFEKRELKADWIVTLEENAED